VSGGVNYDSVENTALNAAKLEGMAITLKDLYDLDFPHLRASVTGEPIDLEDKEFEVQE